MLFDVFFCAFLLARCMMYVGNDACLLRTHHAAKVPVATVFCYNEYGPLASSLAPFPAKICNIRHYIMQHIFRNVSTRLQNSLNNNVSNNDAHDAVYFINENRFDDLIDNNKHNKNNNNNDSNVDKI